VDRFKSRVVELHRQIAGSSEAADVITEIKRQADLAGQKTDD
jgi:hypothetical protein